VTAQPIRFAVARQPKEGASLKLETSGHPFQEILSTLAMNSGSHALFLEKTRLLTTGSVLA
jgi:hypothetical protein